MTHSVHLDIHDLQKNKNIFSFENFKIYTAHKKGKF